MGTSTHFPSSYTLTLIIFTLFHFQHFTNSTLDYTTLIYKSCSPQPLQDPSILPSLFSTLLHHSSSSTFHKTTSTSLTALYQCIPTLSTSSCHVCISKIPPLMSQLCPLSSSSRIHLIGCYMAYQPQPQFSVSVSVSGSTPQMVYKLCSATNVAGSGFEMKRDSGLVLMENGIGNGNGFYKSNYQGVYVVGQCQGDLSKTDCVECIKIAVQKVQVECGSSLSGQVHLQMCFVSYSYSPSGVPAKSTSSSFGSNSGFSNGGGSSVGNTGKTVAIIVGVTAGVGFLIILVLFARGLKKKHDDF